MGSLFGVLGKEKNMASSNYPDWLGSSVESNLKEKRKRERTQRKSSLGTYSDPDTGVTKSLSEYPDWLGSSVESNRQQISTTSTEPTWLTNAPDMASRRIGSTGAITSSDYYRKALEEQQRAIRERTDQAVAANNAYIPQIQQRSKQALQNAYIANQQARMRAPQALNALGMTGGASESSLLGLDTNYQNARSQIEQERSRALEGIRQNEAQIRATGDATLSEAAASYYDKLVAAALEAERQAQDQANWEAEFALQQKQYEDAAAQQAWQNAYDERLYELQRANAGKASGLGGLTAGQSLSAIQAAYNSGDMTYSEYLDAISRLGVKIPQSNDNGGGSGIKQSVGAVAQGLTPKNFTYRDVYNSIVPNRTPEGVRAAAQRLLAQGANPSYVEEALRALGYQ
jgi:hypothetical protein